MIRVLNRRQVCKSLVRLSSTKSPLSVAFKTGDDDDEAVRYRHQKNPEVPSLEGLAQRWKKLDAGKQDDVIAYLEDKMRGSWHELTTDEKKAVHYVWYGNWGPRDVNERDPGNLYLYLASLFAVSAGGLAAYKWLSFKPEAEIPGIEYDK